MFTLNINCTYVDCISTKILCEKIHVSISLFNSLYRNSSHMWLLLWCIVHLQSFYSLNYPDFSNVVKCLSFVSITPSFKKTVFYVLGLSQWWTCDLYNYNFQLKAQISLLRINPDSYFFYVTGFLFFIFKTVSAKYSSFSNCHLSVHHYLN